MSHALITAMTAMQNDMRQLDTVSQNMVNVTTTGYKRAIPAAHAFEQALRAEAAGAGTPPARVDLAAGPLKQTGRAWDLALSAGAYFELASADGPAYTRAGDFRMDGQGRVVSQNGLALQGMQGDLRLDGEAVKIDHNGAIWRDGVEVGRIRMVRFADPQGLRLLPNGLLQPVPGNTATEASAELQSGYLEGSNVAAMREMVALMEITRRFEASQKLYQGYDEMLGSAIQKLGQF